MIICYWGEKTRGRFRNNFRVSLETSSLRHHRTFNLNLFIPLQRRRSHKHGCVSGGEEEKTTDHPAAGYPAASLFPACLSADLSLRLNVSFVFYRDRKCEDDQTLLHVRPLDLISATCHEPQRRRFSWCLIVCVLWLTSFQTKPLDVYNNNWRPKQNKLRCDDRNIKLNLNKRKHNYCDIKKRSVWRFPSKEEQRVE